MTDTINRQPAAAPTRALDARLDAAASKVLAEISRTDAKAGVLLTAFSLPLAALLAANPSRNLPALPAALVGLGGVGLIVAMLTVLLAVRPRLGGAANGSYLHWARCTPEELVKDLEEPVDQPAHVIHLARIAKRKYRGLRTAGDITVLSLLALAAALVTALL
ncbi:Pycsar system effector family protein (plasmid) [Streptomyces sp. SDT5-1]|uniref:Pycsar system effector family protein n=1 Tax=Streptomyces sp. SDT5-1 TaxID=3406418 RepID=UPI003FD5A5B0